MPKGHGMDVAVYFEVILRLQSEHILALAGLATGSVSHPAPSDPQTQVEH